MSRVFLSPCGTSLLTNGIDQDLRGLLLSTSNDQEGNLTPEQKQKIDQHLTARSQLLQKSEIREVKRLSAELNGILTYYQDQIPSSGQDIHFVLGTDTYQGGAVVQMVVDWLRDRGLNAQPYNIKDLATKNRDTFRIAMSDLIQWCEETLRPYQATNHHQVIFNLTGGFKSVIGFLQAVGMFYADECTYIFQSSSELLSIPRLPIKLDVNHIIEENLTLFRQLEYKQLSRIECQNIPETLLWEDDGLVVFSEWGQLIWKQAKRSFYEQQLLPPLSENLVYSAEFTDSAQQIQPDRLSTLNERLDDLSRYLESPRDYNPPKLDFKRLRGKPFADSTHECDIWGDRGDRIYGHFFSESRYQCDRIGRHL